MEDFTNRRRGVDERARDIRKVGASLGSCIPLLGELFFGIAFSRSRTERCRVIGREVQRCAAGLWMAYHAGFGCIVVAFSNR
jgi:hypothetical protein